MHAWLKPHVEELRIFCKKNYIENWSIPFPLCYKSPTCYCTDQIISFFSSFLLILHASIILPNVHWNLFFPSFKLSHIFILEIMFLILILFEIELCCKSGNEDIENESFNLKKMFRYTLFWRKTKEYGLK